MSAPSAAPAAASPLPGLAQPSPPYSETPAAHVAAPPASYFPVPAAPPAPAPVDATDLSDVKLEGTEDPRNWSSTRKWSTAAIISFMGFISPLGSSIVVPGSAFIDDDFNLGSQILSLLPVSLFVLGLGMGPFILAPASELKGRQPVYLVSSVVFVLFNVATAVAPNHAALVILRFLAGAAGSAGPSLGAGSIGDMFAPAERGRAQSLYGLGPLLGPVCGTIAGGWLSQEVRSWRWLLWVLTILSGAVVVIIALFLRETYGPVLLLQKQRRVAAERLKQLELLRQHAAVPDSGVHEQHDVLHRVVSAGRPSNPVVRHLRALVPGPAAIAKTKLAFSRPFRLLFTNPICAAFSLYMGFIYGIIFLFLTQHPLLFQRRDPEQEDEPRPDQLPTYGWRPGPASMTYLGLGFGFLTAALINVLLQDAIYHRLTASRGRVGWYLFDIPELIEQRMILRDAQSQPSTDVEATAADAPPCAERESSEKMQKLEPACSISQEKAAAAAWTAGPSAAAAAQPTPSAPPARKGRPEYRLPLCLVGMIILPIGLLVFGWAADARAHWMAPLVGSYLVGMGSILPFQVILVYLVDAFVPFSASATACAVLVRSVLAAAFPLFAQKLFVSIGYGPGSSILAGVAILAIPVPLVLFWKGEGLRQRYKFAG